ncbi:MAG: methyltransferase domain-containing protein [Actinomycetota bacterium]|nr:methyltransferase domain-containing protein [Actinomycetota bacterium]
MTTLTKDWNRHVTDAEEIARGTGFRHLRDRILELAAPQATDVVVDIGSGTGLLSLKLAPLVEQVWAIDISASMVDYLRTKAASAGLQNVDAAVASAVSLPLVDAFADLVVSNYCFHHMGDLDKRRALQEAMRVLRPGGRLVIGDMMFDFAPDDPRNRAVIAGKARAMLHKGPAGVLRLAKNAVRLACGRWERPARAQWWRFALTEAGFTDVEVTLLEHEGGLAWARRPLRY